MPDKFKSKIIQTVNFLKQVNPTLFQETKPYRCQVMTQVTLSVLYSRGTGQSLANGCGGRLDTVA